MSWQGWPDAFEFKVGVASFEVAAAATRVRAACGTEEVARVIGT